MRIVLHTHSASWVESARVALEAEGIDAVLLDEYSPGTLGLQGSLRLAVSNDADEERAKEIVQAMAPPKGGDTLPSWRWHKRALLAFVTAFATMLVAPTLNLSRNTRLAVLAVDVFLWVLAVVLYLAGHLADARRPQPPPD